MVLKVYSWPTLAETGNQVGKTTYFGDVAQVDVRQATHNEGAFSITNEEESHFPIHALIDTGVNPDEVRYALIAYKNGASERVLFRTGEAFLMNDKGDTIEHL